MPPEVEQSASFSVDSLDSDLMLAYGRGEAGSFELLYQRHKESLFAFFKAGTSDHNTALDLYQETWARVINQSAQYQVTAQFKTWLYTIARNCLIDFYRRNSKKSDEVEFSEEFTDVAYNEVTSIAPPLQPDEITALHQRGDHLHRVVDTLPLQQREALVLRHIIGMTVQEIAVVMDENPETIKSRLRYAVQRLRKELRVPA